MQIGMLTTGYPHTTDPVAGAFVLAMARALAARGHTVRVLCAALPGDAPVAVPGVTVTPVAYGPWRTFYGSGAPDAMSRDPRAALGGVKYVFALALAARALAACDALVSHFVLPCGMVGGWIHGGRPHLAVVHGTDGRWLARMPRSFQYKVFKGATVVQCTHDGLRHGLTLPDVPVVVRAMGFDPLTLSRVPWTGRERTVLAVSRLVAVKRVDRVIDAVGIARSQGSPIRLVIVGDGPERGTLERHPAARDVTLTGALDAHGRDEWLARADVFVHGAGAGEGAPVAVLEAMGAGVPVVAMDGGGVRAMVGHGGVVVNSVEAMAKALKELAEDDCGRLAMGARAREIAWPMRWEAEAERVEGLLRGGSSWCPEGASSGRWSGPGGD